ncbi:GH92 family glycosyl hydrolase [uncultured Alistipes sp.]|jgi:putative alpha-1,2-mannosidase|uniref:GH92 family glycosyl hydrolase n=1 Tax=uncultured Alistipes sp. TaxID=538949 RepID=UPI0025EB7B7B|nr:GH92 family glycosyl hydrolase [uncultured Alistipes sp.]
MNFRTLSAVAAGLLLAACSQAPRTESLTQYVDMYIGTGGHGHVFMGANVPFGAVQLGPTSIPIKWDWVSGYHISDQTVIGFSHTHLNGTGIGDLFDVTLMPVVGEVTYARGTEDDPQSGLWSYFSRENEKARPGYYATRLDRYGVDVELTATKRVGLHRYTFPASADAAIVFDLENGGCWDAPTRTYIERTGDRTIAGYRYSTGWAKDQRIYFTAEFSMPFTEVKLFEAGENAGWREGASLEAERVYGRVCFDTTHDRTIYVKVAISPVSVENARLNMQSELPGWDFEATALAADQAWNAELEKVRIETADDAARRIFYTALYHTMIAPSEFCDVNGDYRGADGKVYREAQFVNYTTFSLWDTYRAAQPLMTILHPEKIADIANTMLHIYRQQGKLPVWHLVGNETDCMVGNPGIPAMADIVLKGYGGFDKQLAYDALKESAMLAERGMDLRMKYGYIPCDLFNESVAFDMEYALADWAVAQVAREQGHTADHDYFLARSKSYKHFFDPQTHFMRGLDSKGRFRTPFNPVASSHREDDYCEGNAWQYTWLVPHDVEGLIGCFGGREAFTAKLDSLFSVSSKLEDGASPDISGLIGQYAHGNEPSHHIVYFYTMIGQPGKTADKVREILTTLYHDQPDGLSGNEDVGQMSAWYILSSMGFYQVEPAGGRYFFGSPLFDKVEMRVRDGVFTITAHNNSADNKYIRSVKLNGKLYEKPYIDFGDIAAGGSLEFEMGAEPALWYAI